MTGLPQSYTSPLHLPFNRTCLEGRFELSVPDRDPGTPGFWLILQGSRLVVVSKADAYELPNGPVEFLNDCPAVYLGLWRQQPCRLVRLPREIPLPPGWQASSLTEEDPQLPIELLSLGGLGRMILHWQDGSGFCQACGGPMQPLVEEWGRVCPVCNRQHFPHVHPCAIVLVRRPGEVLLTRKPQWAPNRYSLVAGFTEFGECLEETAAREVAEETGIEVRDLRYIGSQCWPFPSQLMCGFVADYAGGEVQVDTTELADARWFKVDALPQLPPKRSIARFLLDNVLELDG